MTSPEVEIAWVIKGPKVSAYLLNLKHPVGGSKAKYLLGFGFKAEEPDVLANALAQHAMLNLPGERVIVSKGPPRVVFEGTVPAPDGRDMPLRTIWEPRDPLEMHFISAVPLTR